MQSFLQLRMFSVLSQSCRASSCWIRSHRHRRSWPISRASLPAGHLCRHLTTPCRPLPYCRRSFSWLVSSWSAATVCSRHCRPPTTAPSPFWSGPATFLNSRWVLARTRFQSTASNPAELPTTPLLLFRRAAVVPLLPRRVPSLRHRLPSSPHSLSPGRNQFRAGPDTSRLSSLTLSRTGALLPFFILPVAPPAPSGRPHVIAPSKHVCFFFVFFRYGTITWMM
jgi:hypothetical protein